MATGIVSVVLRSDGHPTVSRVLAVIGAVLWVLLASLFVSRLLREPARWRREAARPAALTAVAGTAVLGVRATQLDWSWMGWVLLGLASLLSLALLASALRALRQRSQGVTFLLVVAPESVAVLSGEVARRGHHEWLALAALWPFLFGLVVYATVLAHYPLRGLRSEPGDHWITGGALAISTLACGELALASRMIPGLHEVHGAFRAGTIVLWALTVAWLPVLIGVEIRWPRLSYDVRRWATVFPVGMYAAMSFTAAGVLGAAWMRDFARVWTWVALAAWVAVGYGAARRLWHGRGRGGA
jgi:tellurite resistance protein TehA-like permease